MKLPIILLITSFTQFFNTSYSQNNQATVVVSNLDNREGVLFMGWYKSASNFARLEEPDITKKITVSAQRETAIVFDNLASGGYAISVFFDENGNGKLDTNFFGKPKEKYGFSNNILPAMRAATFEEARFVILNKPETIRIRLK